MRDKCKGKHNYWDLGDLCADCKEVAAIYGCTDCLSLFCKPCAYEHCCCKEFTHADAAKMLEVEAEDPVHYEDGCWYFWDEIWSDRHGPYTTEWAAIEACKEYAENL